MIGSMVRLLRDPFGQDIALSNAQQSAARLAHRRRQREDVDAYLAQLPGNAQRPVQGRPNPKTRAPIS